ncbi:MAG: sulfotransferase [Gemmatimonadetes bacterium]|nr:sulfotransferase [Gemmatimonadota bacterium]
MPVAPRPNFFIVGAPRCGTTSMHYYLSQHPAVYMPPVKELHFFGRDLDPELVYPVPADADAYLAFFAPAGSRRGIGETSPFYLYSRTAPGEIADFSPDARIVIMLRNPVDLMYSWFCGGRFSSAFIPAHRQLASFEAAVAGDLKPHGEVSSPDGPPRSRGRVPQSYRDLAAYAQHVKRYLDAFGRARIHVVWFDELTSAPGPVFQRICRFLEVDPGFIPDFAPRNQSRHARVRTLVRFLIRPPPLARHLARALVPASVRPAIRSVFWRLAVTHPPPLDPAVRCRVLPQFADDILKLQTLLDRDLSHWLRCDEAARNVPAS